MTEIKNREIQDQNQDQEKNKSQEQNKKQVNQLKIDFKEPYTFEGKVYNGIDLSPMEDMTGDDFIRIEKAVRMLGISNLNSETVPEGAFMYAARAANLPLEFFGKLPLVEARKIKVAVINFLWG